MGGGENEFLLLFCYFTCVFGLCAINLRSAAGDKKGILWCGYHPSCNSCFGCLEIHSSIGAIWPNAIFRFGESSSVFPPGNGVNHPFLPPFQIPLDPIQSLTFLCALQLGFFYPHLRLFPAFQVSPMKKKRPKHIVSHLAPIRKKAFCSHNGAGGEHGTKQQQ